ncbi:MAG TPA: type II toxin-antitoxin system death-on-curing family toxin [Actinomycetes bacterium]|jgi:death-on-curing protein|nr:type II toxin-antitoxin system death-on-curing family toxin [Actinomycetes bacterium]
MPTPPHDVQYLDLADYLYLAGAALDVAPEDLFHTTDLALAESALHAPAATFAGIEFYGDLVSKAAVLVIRLAKNHPLLDGNKRAAYLAMLEFLARNGRRFVAADVDQTIDMMVKIAGSAVGQDEVEDWILRQLG